jgi:L-alanine-DL-glutamate epimerase-like enolase superfamily enzyme
MQIESVEVFTLRLPHHYRVGGHANAPGRLPGTDYYVEPQWVHAYSSVTEAAVVKITADDGSIGWGECQAPLTPQTPCSLITTLLGPSILGFDPRATALLFDRMYHLMLARGHTGSFLMDAIAGIDIALWDLKARRLGVPIFELLGGPFQLEMPAYISGLRMADLDGKIAAARRFQAEGFAGVKIFSGETIQALETEARAVREAIGPDSFFALDAICKYDLSHAIRIGRVLDAMASDWFEAPLNAEDIESHAALARAISTPVAVGETLRSARQFEPWLRNRALAIAQPDVMRTGITASMQIANLAHTMHVPTTMHTGVCTGIGMAATWQIAAALPCRFPQEHQHGLFESGARLLVEPLEVKAGRLLIPQRPGIGVNVNEQAVGSMSSEHWLVDSTGRKMLKGGPQS